MSNMDAVFKAAGRKKRKTEEDKVYVDVDRSTTNNTTRRKSNMDAVFAAAGRERASRTFYSSAPTSSNITTKKSDTETNTTPKVATKTTIKSDLSESERKSRIKAIDSELNSLNAQKIGLSRAGGSSKALATKGTEINNRIAVLKEEKKKLERTGTFSASEMKQFEIDDAEERVSVANNKVNSFGARPTLANAEAYKNAVSEKNKANQEVDLLERDKAQYKRAEWLDGLNKHTKKVTSNKDFAANSKYSPIPAKTEEQLKAEGYKQDMDGDWYKRDGLLGARITYTGEDSNHYIYINDKSQRERIGNIATARYGTNIYKDLGYDTLTDEEIGAFNYLYHQDRKNGTKTAETYLQNISPLLQERALANEATHYKEVAKEYPVTSSVFSLGTNLANAAMFPTKAIATATGGYEDHPELDMFGNRTQAIRGGVSEDMPWLGRMVYNGAMSIGDMGVAMLAGGGNAKAIQAVMSSSAGSSTISEAKKNGASDGKALVLGLGSAAIEWATEKWSVEKILQDPKTLKGFLIENTFTEATEEGASNIGNAVLDGIVSSVFNERSELEQRIDYLVLYEGKSEEEALKIAFNEKLQSFGEDVLVGGLTGFGMSGAKVAGIGTENAIRDRQYVSSYMQDGEMVDALVEEGKSYGEGSKPFNLAEEVAQAKDNGSLSRKQISKLIKANDKAEKSAPTTLEQAAREVVEEKEARAKTTPIYEKLETLSRNNEQIAVEDAKRATGFGNRGAELVAKLTNTEGATFYQTVAEIKPSYETGFDNPDLDIKKVAHTFDSQAQQDAYTAGQIDGKLEQLARQERAKNVVVNKESGFKVENFKNKPLPSDVTPSQVKTVDLMAKALGVKAYMAEGLMGNAEIDRETGEVPIDVSFEREVGEGKNKQKVSIVFHAAHEMAVHRVCEVAPEEGYAFVKAFYKYLASDGDSTFTLADEKRYAYAKQGVDISYATAKEEVTANNLLRLYGNNEAKFHRAIERIVNGTDTKAKQGLRKYIEILNDIIRKIGELLTGVPKSERARIQAELNEVRRLRDMFEGAFAKAVENARAVQSTNDTNSSNNLEIKINEEYNGNVSHSLKGESKSSEQFGVMWTLDEGVLDKNEVAAFYEKISETKNNKYLNYHNAADGQLIYEIGDKLIYTDGDYDYPHISKVIAFNTNDSYWLEYGRESFYDGEKYGYQTETIVEIVEAVLGEGAVKTATYDSYETNKRSGKSSDKRTDGREVNQRSGNDVKGKKYSLKDTEYLELAKNPVQNKAELDKMVYEAAKRAGYATKVYHGTTGFGFTKIDVKKSDDSISFFATDSLDLAQSYSGAIGERQIKNGSAKTSEMEQVYNDKLIAFINKVNAVAGKEIINRNDLPFDTYANKIKKGKMDSAQLWSEMINHTFEVMQKIEQYRSIDSAEDVAIWEASSELESALNLLTGKSGNYGLYANTDGFLEIEGNGAKWSSIPFDKIPSQTTANTREIVKWAKENGYNGVLFKNIYDIGNQGNIQKAPANVYAFLNPKEQLKSADNVTYNAFGKAIPLSERFNKKNNDIRYSLKDTEGKTLTKEQAEYFKDSKVRDKDGNLIVVYHGSPESFTIFDTHKDTSSIIYDASFFTSDESRAKAYADKNNTTGYVYKGYLNITNPLMPSKVREQISLIPDSVKEKYQGEFDLEESVSKSDYAIIDFAKYVARKENSTMATVLRSWGFDGYINGTDYAIFESEQFKDVNNTNPTSNPDINFSLKDSFSTEGMTESDIKEAQNVISALKTYAMSSKYLDGFAAYTTERMEREIADSSSKTEIDFASSYITWVEPIDFVYATTTSEQYRQHLREEAGTLNIEKLKGETQPIHLTVDFATGEIIGHEGRHRMLALQQEGIDRVAIIIDALNDDRHHTKPIEFMSLKGQRFEYRKGVDMYLHNMLPLSKRYADTARELFTTKPKSGIQYSLKGEDINKLSTEEKTVVDALGKGAEAITNKKGDMLIATNKNKSTVMYSLKTYQDGGKEALEKALRSNGHTEAEIRETLSWVDDAADYLTILAAGYAKSHGYNALSDHLVADIITNVKTGKQVISAIVNNGDYPVNIDLALICKKRVAYMNLMNRLIDDGVFDKVNYGGEAIAKVNELLRADGFETACLGCFVESRRLQFQTWAETIVSEWNAEVDKRTKDAGSFNFADGKAKLTDAEMDALAEELKNAGKKNAQGNLNLGQGSIQTKMGRLLDKVPSLQKHLTVADLLKPEGLTALRAYDSNLFSIVKSRYGAASPKIVQDYNPYASEIAMMTFSSVKNITSKAIKGADSYRRKVINEMGGRPVKQQGETTKAFNERKAEFNAKVEDEAIRRYLYDIGGARIQSFSDFMIENVFDYIQIFADLSAKRLPLHGYTKEIVALRLFGMTGAKWNGSLIASVDRSMGKEYAGLLPASEAKDGSAILVHTEDGDFAIGFDDYARYKATNKKTFIQSIGMKDMIALQLDPRYSSYVGSITIGVSDKQILAMLDSPLFRFVIPYHSSGMLPQFAKLVGVDLYNDYTDYQNTTVKQWFDAYGNPCDPISDVDVDTSYNFNAEVQKTGDAKKAANNYLKWCGQKHPIYKGKKLVGYATFNPKFSNSPYGTDFTKHENYYKMLEDFNCYDNITEESTVQGAVTMTFPSEQNRLTSAEMEAYKESLRETGIFSEKEIEKYSKIADKTFKELIADEVKGRAEYQKAQSPKWENTVKNVEEMLLTDHQRKSFSLKGTSNTTSDGKKILGASERLAKYAKEGVIPTEVYTELVEKYGFIPYGENPSRDVQVPRKTEKGKKVSQTVRTILEAKATPDETLPTIQKMVEDGVFSYEVYTDKKAIQDAEDMLNGYGWLETYNTWMKDVEEGIVSKQHTVQGWALYNNAVNRATTATSEAERKTAMETALTVLDAMVRHQRNAAQALQATRVLKKLSPESQLYGVKKSVEAFQKELTEKYGDKAPNLKIDEQLAEEFLNAETQEERDKAIEEIYKDIGRQMPSRFIDKWNAWRYLAMLGNPRTHIRNIVGNLGFAPVVAAKNLTATAIESVVHRVSGGKTIRGKAMVWGSKADRALLKAAWNDYSNVADLVSNGGKYNESAMTNQAIQDGRQIFKFKPLEWARKGNSNLLEKEDALFSQPHYAYALAQYCKANNITPEQISRGKAIAPAREYAIKEAQKATYRDTNAFSQFVSELGRSGNKKNPVSKGASIVLEGILPFRKTPANILVRGIEYSPIGLLKGLSYDLYQASKGKMTASEVIDNISAGLTGTGLLALGLYLAAEGLVRGHGEDEEDEKKFKEMMGHQSYALELPNGESITLDWLAPEALPFFVGVNLWETSKGSNEETSFANILQSVTNITEPMLEMSCLQSLNDLFEGIGYASSNDTSGLVSVLSSAATSYLTQGLPTILGQAERTGEDERMTTYTEKNGFLTGDMQYTLGKMSAKIPAWDYNQIPYIDAWGRKEASGTALKRGLNNFLNPAYTSTIEKGSTEEELLRLYGQTGEGSVFPTRADKYFMVDGVRKDLTADEYVKYATLKGEKSYKLVSDLIKSNAYKKLSNEEKVKAIADVYDYANQKAKQSVSNYKPQSWVGKADEFSNVGNYISFKTEVASTKESKGDNFSKQDVIDIIIDMAQNDSEVWKMYLSQYDAEKDLKIRRAGIGGAEYMAVIQNVDKYDRPNKNGKLGTYTNEEIATAVGKTYGLTKRERAILWQELTGSTSTKNNPWRRYLP